MNIERGIGAAATRWSDYVGTAAADDAAVTAGRPSLYELAGLDRDQWLVAAVDIEVEGGQLGVVVYVIDRLAETTRRLPYEVDDVVAEHGHLPVKAVRLGQDSGVQDFLDQVFQRVAIRLVARSFRDDPLVVQGDAPQETPQQEATGDAAG